MSALMCAVLVATCVYLWVPGVAAGRLTVTSRTAGARLPVTPAVVLGVLVALALLAWVAGLGVALWATTGVVVVATLARVLAAHRADRLRRQRRVEVARAARVLAAQLRIGQVPTAALRSAAEDCPPLERPAATMAVGGDVAAALRAVGAEPGLEGLVRLAMAWEISERSGAPIADLARTVAEALRASEATRTAVSAELAAPRATGRLLAALPLMGIAMGTVAGGQPVRFLTHTVVGQFCLLAGVTLACAGVLWTEWLADRAMS